ncbi:hypothetical protein ACWD48_29220, partial [Streptomyces sp. NPDC002519]
MIEIGVLLGLMLTLAIALIVKLVRRSTTENVEGLLIEQARRVQAHNDRVSYNAYTMRVFEFSGGVPPVDSAGWLRSVSGVAGSCGCGS